MATHSSILAWKIPWTEEPGRLQSKGLHRARHDWATERTHTPWAHTHTPWAHTHTPWHDQAFQVALVVKNPPADVGDVRDMGSIPGLERPLGGGHGNLLQYSCLEKPMDRGTWGTTVHRIAKSWTRLNTYTLVLHLCLLSKVFITN